MIDLPLLVGSFVAGVLMFLAPCTLPIVPGYLAFIAGVPAGQAGSNNARRRILINALAFVIGFSLIFIILGSFAAAIGALLGPWRLILARVAGIVIIIFGLTMLGVWQVPFLSGERHVRLPRWLSLGYPHSSFLIGALFALGWSPCIGPILGTVLFLASASATALQGALLLGVFSLGLAIPFLLCAWGIGYAETFARRAGPLTQILSVVGGVILILLGLLMLTGNMALLVSWGYELLNGVGYERLLNYL
jgi:cytochrome c-type biogenesis protein